MTNKIAAYAIGGAAVVASKVLSVSAGFMSLWLLNQILPKEIFGYYATTLAIIYLVEIVATGGLDQSILFRLSRQRSISVHLTGGGLVRSALITVVLTGLLFSVASVALGTMAPSFVSLPGIHFWLIGFAAVIPLNCVQVIFAAWNQSQHRISESVLVPTLVTVSRPVFLGAAMFAWPTQGGVAIAIVLAAALPVAIWIFRTPFATLRTSGSLSRQDRVYGLKRMLGVLANRGMKRVDILMLGIMTTGLITAEFAVAAQIALVTRIGNQLYAPTLTPRIGHHLSGGRFDQLDLEYRQSQFFGLCAGIVVCILIVVAAAPILELLGDYRLAYPVLLVLCAANIISVGFGGNVIYLNMAGHANWSLYFGLVLLTATIVLNWILIPTYGALGAAFGTLFALFGNNAMVSLYILTKDGMRTLSVPVVATLTMVVTLLIYAATFEAEFRPLGAIALAIILIGYILAEKKMWWSVTEKILSKFMRI